MKTFTKIEQLLTDIILCQILIDQSIDLQMSLAPFHLIRKANEKIIELNQYPGDWVNAVRLIIQLRNQK